MIIPGDIKVKNNLNPQIQGYKAGSVDKGNMFAFDPVYESNNRINVYPKNVHSYIGADSSFGEHLNGEDYIYNVPSIKIKEYLPEIPEDQWLNILGDTFKAMEETAKSFKENKDEFKKTMDNIKNSVMDGTLIEAICKNLEGKAGGGMDGFAASTLEDKQLYWFPEFLYRRLLSYQVTNWYILPYSGTINMGSRGQAGWQQKSLGLDGIAKFMKSVNITGRPLWRLNGIDTDNIEFELILFNDTLASAVSNFKFVHTVIPNNMWFQYGIFQHNPSLYDIQFDSGLRYFCCSLDVNCEAVGMLRQPPDNFRDLALGKTADQDSEIQQLKKEKNNLEFQKEVSERELEQLEKDLKEAKEDLDKAKERKDEDAQEEAKTRKADLEAEIESTKEFIGQLEWRMKTIESGLESISKKHEGVGGDQGARNQNLKSDSLYAPYFKIPDMYKVTFKFKSLLPTNFNTYLMTFCEKPMDSEDFEDESTGHFKSIYNDFGVAVADSLKQAADGGLKKESNDSEQQAQTYTDDYKGDGQ